LLIIHWNQSAFDQTTKSRDSDPSHTLENLVEHIKAAGGEDIDDKHIVFAFKTGTDCGRCTHSLPPWCSMRNFTCLGFLNNI
jgi:hypothetical protein